MQISISSQHIEKLSNSLQIHAKAKLKGVVKKYLEDVASVNIHFSKQRNGYSCSIIVTIGQQKQVIKGVESGYDIYASFDQSMIKLETQLKKYKSKQKSNYKNKIKTSLIESLNTDHRSDFSFTQDEELTNNPVIIAEKPNQLASLSVSEAVIKMDLEHVPAIIFLHSKTGRVNVVYYRHDGNISWIDSK